METETASRYRDIGAIYRGAEQHRFDIGRCISLDFGRGEQVSLSPTVSIRAIHIARFPERRLLGHTRGVNACGWSSFYKFICSGGQDRVIILWNPFSLKPLASLIGHAAPIVSVAVHDRGNQLISLSADKCIKVCRPAPPTAVFDFRLGVGHTKSWMSTNTVRWGALSPGRHIECHAL